MKPNTGYLGVTPPIATSGPSKLEDTATEELMKALSAEGGFESEERYQRSEQVLGLVNDLFKAFVRRVSLNVGMAEQPANEAGGKLFPFGSYRMGVHGQGSDINILCAAPMHVTYTDFFRTFEPTLKETEGVSGVVGVSDAYVPVIRTTLRDIPVHFSFAGLNLSTVPENLELGNGGILVGIEEHMVQSLAGPRVADDILRLVPNQDVFRDSLRCIRLWAQRRAIYSSLNGFLGGIEWAILVARVCQLYPNLNAAAIVHRFFIIMVQWKWPQPVLLRRIVGVNVVDHTKGLELKLRVWDPKIYPSDRNHLMPIITPAYPSMCSSHKVTRSTLSVMKDEFRRGSRIVEMIVTKRAQWSELFTKHDFFQKYHYYLQIIASSRTSHEQLRWSGTVGSRLRQLVTKLELVDQLEVVHPFVTGFNRTYYCVDDVEVQAVAQGGISSAVENRKEGDISGAPGVIEVHTSTFYIGLKLVGKQAGSLAPRKVDISQPTAEFVTRAKQWFQYREETHEIVVRYIKSSALPNNLFDGGVRPVVTKSHGRNESH